MRLLFWKKRKKTKDQEETLKMIGALTIMELNKSRSLRRKIEKTEYGRKLRRLIKY